MTIDKALKAIEARLAAVREQRDKIDDLVSEMESLRDDCDEGIVHLQESHTALTNARDSLSKVV